jgi:hypothetical protein
MLPRMPQQLRTFARSFAAWTTSRPSTRQARFLWLVSSIAIAGCVLLVSIPASNHQRHEAGFDILDEGAHYDYVVQLSQGHLPRSGTRLTQQTLRMLSCVGGFNSPAHGCEVKHRNPEAVGAQGYNYEAILQPPLAYLPYLLTVDPNGSSQASLETARWGGVIWSVVGAGLLIWVAWMLDLSLLELTGVLTICLLNPVQTRAIASVTTDSGAIPAGAAVVATYLLSRRRHRPMVVVGLLVGLVVGFMKGLFVLAPLVVLMSLVFTDIARRHLPTRRELLDRYGCSAAMLIGATVSYAAWLLIQDARAIVPTSTVLHAVEGFSTTSHIRLTTVLNGVQAGLSDLMAYVPAPLYWIWDLAVYGSVAGLLFLRGPAARISQRATALAIFFGVAALALVFPLTNFIEGHYDFSAPARYALPALPIIALLVMRTFRTSAVVIVGIVMPALAIGYQLWTTQF